MKKTNPLIKLFYIKSTEALLARVAPLLALKLGKNILVVYVMLISMEYATQENISGEIYTVGKLTKIKTNVYNIIKNECKKIVNGFK